MSDLSNRLRHARKRAGLTQQDVAEHMNMARTTVVAIEQGKRKVKAHELIALAGLYGVKVADLVRKRPTTAGAFDALRMKAR